MNGTWRVSASNLGTCQLGDVVGIGISIDSCPDRWSTCFSDSKVVSATSASGTGIRTAFAANPGAGYLLAGVGFNSNGWLRPLDALVPVAPRGWLTGGAQASTSGDTPGKVTALGVYLKR